MLNFFLIVSIALVSNTAYSAVDIFDQNRDIISGASQKELKKTPLPTRGRAKKLKLSFVGISKTNATMLYFKDEKHKQLKLRLYPDKNNYLPGYPDLRIEKVENRTVYVHDTTMNFCQDNKKTGIICQSENSMIEMHLVRKYVAQPRHRNKISRVGTRNKKNTGQPVPSPSNPFGKPVPSPSNPFGRAK